MATLFILHLVEKGEQEEQDLIKYENGKDSNQEPIMYIFGNFVSIMITLILEVNQRIPKEFIIEAVDDEGRPQLCPLPPSPCLLCLW